MAGTIVFNGKTYNSVDEMPPEVRQAYEKVVGLFADKNQNGIPDVFEGIGSVNRQNINIKKKTTAIIYDGKKYDNVEQLPPEARQKYEQAMGKLDADKDGIPDFIEGMMGTSSASTMTSELPASQPVFSQPSTVSVNSPSAIEPENNSLRWLIIGIGLIIVLCMGAIGMWVLFGR
jgi:hypothetical protein